MSGDPLCPIQGTLTAPLVSKSQSGLIHSPHQPVRFVEHQLGQLKIGAQDSVKPNQILVPSPSPGAVGRPEYAHTAQQATWEDGSVQGYGLRTAR